MELCKRGAVRRAGYAPLRQRITAPRFGEPFHLEVVLETGRRARGQVVDLADQPVPGADGATCQILAGIATTGIVPRPTTLDSTTSRDRVGGDGGRRGGGSPMKGYAGG